ncbi:MAG: GNAT family N-acetyltransferase [Arenimonas sp.]|nr:GNAT family N-acetyltransferase [Arenimonas sp.]
MAFTLETKRLLLREFTIEDAPYMLRQLNEASFIKNIADRGVRTIQQAEDYLQHGAMASYQKSGFGFWAVIEKSSAQIIGMCGLVQRDNLPAADLGYSLLPEYFGRGFAFEATEACINAAKNAFNLPELLAIVNTANIPSRTLLEKLGFDLRRVTMQTADEPSLCIYGIDLN